MDVFQLKFSEYDKYVLWKKTNFGVNGNSKNVSRSKRSLTKQKNDS
jgi:hypothetical protein